MEVVLFSGMTLALYANHWVCLHGPSMEPFFHTGQRQNKSGVDFVE